MRRALDQGDLRCGGHLDNASMVSFLECRRADRAIPGSDFGRILTIHIKEMCHRGLDRRLPRIVRRHRHKSPKHLERPAVPVLDNVVMGGEALVHERTQGRTNGFPSVPVAYTQVRYGIFPEAVKTLAPGLII